MCHIWACGHANYGRLDCVNFSAHSGPEGERLVTLSPVGTLERRGLDTYSATVTRSTGNHGDMYTCTASNGASSSTRNYTISAVLAPTNVTWEQITPSVIRIQWLQPDGGAPVHSYTITALFGKGVVAAHMTLKPRNRDVTIQRLVNDGRPYTVSIMAMSDGLPGVATFTVSLSECAIITFCY